MEHVRNYMKERDYGLIAACRSARDCGYGKKYTERENKKRDKWLSVDLEMKGYGVKPVRGHVIENYGSDDAREIGEELFLVVDVSDYGTLKKYLIGYGTELEQDAVLYGNAGRPPILIGTNHSPKNPLEWGEERKYGGRIFGKKGEFLRRAKGRPFVFTGHLGEYSLTYPRLRGWMGMMALRTFSASHWSLMELRED